MSDAVERVRKARNSRGWSIRTAASEGGTSNQTWGTFEKTGNLTDTMQQAIMKAFGWPASWRDDDPEPGVSLRDEVARLQAQVAHLAEQMKTVRRQLAGMGVEVERTAGRTRQPSGQSD